MEERGLTVIDLFCGAGGFSEGFHQAGFDVVLGVDNWRPACETHRLNGLGVTLNKDLLKVELDDVISIRD
ncbi:MAG: DNA cytosine methyltransferase, partial [Thermoplasmata archaeon]